MQRLDRKLIFAVALASSAPLISACSGGFDLPSLPTINTPRPEVMLKGNFLNYSGQREDFALHPAGPQELVGPDGQCAYAATAPTADPGVDPATAGLVQGGVALQMTECEVVRRAGPPEQVELGANERGERSAVLTYVRGPRPGIYRFASGRLYSIERGPEPVVTRTQKAPPKKRAQANPN